MTHFEVFGLAPRIDLDVEALEKKHRELALKLHPDRTRGDAGQRRAALEQTTALNDAFKVLKDRVKRAFYLLKLHGVDLDREDLGAQKDMPLQFLEQVIELREALAETRQAKDVARAQAMGKGVDAQRHEALELAMSALRALEKNPKDPQALQTASHQLGRVRYFTRFLEEVALIEEEEA